MRTMLPIICYAFALAAQSASEKPRYLDPSQPIERRVEDLLARMTLLEKVGQMNMPCVYLRELGPDVKAKQEACRRFTEGTYADGIGPGGGFFTLADNALPQGSRQQALYFNELQKLATEKTRLKIPLLQTEEGTHGLMCSQGTVFPEGLGIGSTWNMDLVRQIYSTVAREGRSVGIHQLFTLVVEPNRDPRLGRNEEGFSEDPYLCSRIAEMIVGGVQGDDVSAPDRAVAGLCHYPGQSQGANGLERGAMEISERMLREVFLPPWVAGIKKAGALGVMATYPAIDGVPAHASEKILTRILREELGFQGLVLGEGGGIGTLVYERLAANQKEAGILALKAGLDVGISYEPGYMEPLVESVEEGRVPMAEIDRSVRRILRQKFRLGLFERPYVDAERTAKLVNSAPHQALALQAARESIVLLKNEKNLLPLAKSLRSIAVIGPNADHKLNLLGDYVAKNVLQNVTTVLDGIRQKAGSAVRISYVKGCDVLGNDRSGFAAAEKAAKDAEIAIVVVGENERRAAGNQGTNGEGKDVASLDLTGVQEDLIRAIHQTGTPTVVVLVNGRPLSTRWTAENIPAIVEAWLPGEKGGLAVAEVLFGEYNPNGRLPISIPRHAGQLPVYYNYKPSKLRWHYVDMSADPLYPFGHGLSYTRFDYSGLRISSPKIRRAASIEVSVDVTNTGGQAGEEVVQLYLTDPIATVSRPVQELKGFRKIALKPGEKKTIAFTLTPEDLSLLDRNLERVVEPGEFRVMVGHSSADIRLKGSFEVE
ncbi:MAG: glycoside hydrolase family 3 C-terminal domain-containing protein [Bryobacterales bacterium]|nr:glycoside hydrolase family 3 C-terminal domain-containing protein [Bryobacterales bacterium]